MIMRKSTSKYSISSDQKSTTVEESQMTKISD